MTHIGGPTIPFTRAGTPLRSVLAGDGHIMLYIYIYRLKGKIK
jgi:hypothetical protein